jgi:hypothetical protein
MKKKSTSSSAFFNLRVLVALLIATTGVSLALFAANPFGRGTGPSSAAGIGKAGQKYAVGKPTNLQLLPPGFDCSKIHELGIDKMENFRAGLIMIACGEAEGGSASPGDAFSQFVQELLQPSAYGTTDVDLMTGAESNPHVTQSETFTASNPDNPNQIVVAYNDSPGRNASPINISGASVSTDGGTT